MYCNQGSNTLKNACPFPTAQQPRNGGSLKNRHKNFPQIIFSQKLLRHKQFLIVIPQIQFLCYRLIAIQNRHVLKVSNLKRKTFKRQRQMKFCSLKLKFSQEFNDEMFESFKFYVRSESERLSSFVNFKPKRFSTSSDYVCDLTVMFFKP